MWSVLEKKGSQALTTKSRKSFFLPWQFLVTRMHPAGTPLTLETAGTSWENWQKLAKGKKSHQSQLSHVSLFMVPSWKRKKKVKFHVAPSFPNSDLQGKTFIIISSSPMDSYCLVSFCVLRTWLGNCQVEDPPIWADRNVDYTLFLARYGWREMWAEFHLQLWSYWLPLTALREIVSFFWLSLGVALDSGRAPSLRTPLESMGLFNMDRNIYYLFQLKPDKIFKMIFLKVALWSEVGQIGSPYSELIRNFLKPFSSKLNYVLKRKEITLWSQNGKIKTFQKTNKQTHSSKSRK